MRRVSFDSAAFAEFNEWASHDRRIYKRIIELINAIARDPFAGVGKPEPLKHQLKGYWSRRIDEKHRLVYKVTDEEIVIASCKYHYNS